MCAGTVFIYVQTYDYHGQIILMVNSQFQQSFLSKQKVTKFQTETKFSEGVEKVLMSLAKTTQQILVMIDKWSKQLIISTS